MEPVETATDQEHLDTVAKPAADPRLLELLNLLDGLRYREDRRTDRDVWRDLSRAVTLYARTVNARVRQVVERAHGAVRAATSLAMASSTRLGKQAVAIEARVARYSEPFTKLELQSICGAALRMINRGLCRVRDHEGISRILKRLQRSAHGNVRDFQELLDELDRGLEQVHQLAAGRPDPVKEKAPAGTVDTAARAQNTVERDALPASTNNG